MSVASPTSLRAAVGVSETDEPDEADEEIDEATLSRDMPDSHDNSIHQHSNTMTNL